MKLVLEMEDPNIVVNLRHLNTGNKSKYDVFWEECKKFLQEGIMLLLMIDTHGCNSISI